MDVSASAQESARPVWSPPLPAADGFEHTRIDIPGARVHVASIGDRDGEPVVMLHGFPQHWWQWRTIAPALAARGYRVICPDLRGSGWTEADAPGFRRDDMLHDLVALLDRLAVGPAHIVAHDLGAVVAMQLAYAHPERVRSALQFSVPPGFMKFDLRLLPGFRHMPRMLLHREGQSMRWVFGPGYVAKPMPADVLDGYLRVQERPEVSRGVSALYRGMIMPVTMQLARGDFTRRMLVPPTLALFGRKDAPWTEELVRHVSRDHARRAERFEFAFVDGGAHFVTDDAPEECTAIVLDWLGAPAR